MSQFSSLGGTDSYQSIHRYPNIQAELVGIIGGRAVRKHLCRVALLPASFIILSLIYHAATHVTAIKIMWEEEKGLLSNVTHENFSL